MRSGICASSLAPGRLRLCALGCLLARADVRHGGGLAQSHYFDDDDSNASFDEEGSDGDAFNDAPDPFAGP